MPIRTPDGFAKKIVANARDIRAVFVGSQRVWPSGEAYFSWPHNTGLLMNSAPASIGATSLTRIEEPVTAMEAYQPRDNPSTSVNRVAPWWATVAGDDQGGMYFELPENQGGKYRVQGTVDFWLDSTSPTGIVQLGTFIVYSAGGSYCVYASTQYSMPVRDKWHRVAYDLTIANSYGGVGRFYPFAVIVTGSASPAYPFAFSNVNVGITRVYT